MGKYFSKEQIEFLETFDKIDNNNFKYITEQFNKKFKSNKTVSAIKTKFYRLNLKTNRLFTKEQESFIIYNIDKSPKQLTELFNKKFNHTKTVEAIIQEVRKKLGLQFINHDKDSTPKPILSERTTKEGYIKIKIKPNKWINKGRYIYEQTYGKVPKDHMIIHLDGNKEHFNIDNLKCIPNEISGKLAKNNQFNLGIITDAASEIYITERILK